MAHDALGAHARDELGLSEMHAARPIQAALASAASFAVGATLPLLTTVLSPPAGTIPLVAACSLAFLALLGGLAARAGGASPVSGRGAGDLLGCPGDGADGGDRRPVRHHGVRRAGRRCLASSNRLAHRD